MQSRCHPQAIGTCPAANRYHNVMQSFVVFGNPPEFESGMKVNGTNYIYFTLLYTKITSTDQHPLSKLVGFLAVSRVNEAVVAIVPSLQKYPQFCQGYESDGVIRHYLRNLRFHIYEIPYMQQTPFI